MEYQRILYEPGMVTRIKLNRPRHLNAISHPVFAELEKAFDEARDDPECRVIVLSGEGSCFTIGHDTLGTTPESAPVMGDGVPPEELMKRYGSEREVWRHYWTQHDYFVDDMWVNKIRRIPKPTIAMVHGYAIFTGFSLARHMDIVFASEDALFLPVGAGGMWDLGPRKMLEILFEHRFMTARECFEYHMINRIFPTREILEKETLAFAYRVAENPASGLAGIKQVVHKALDLQGYTGWFFDKRPYDLSMQQRNVSREEKHRERYDGRGMGRTPRALANLKAKLESEGKEVPEQVLAALARAATRDDKAQWQKALRQEWREKHRVERAEADAKVYEEAKAEEERKTKAEIEGRKKA